MARVLFCDPRNGAKNKNEIEANKFEGALCAFTVVGINSVFECGTKFGATFRVAVMWSVGMMMSFWQGMNLELEDIFTSFGVFPQCNQQCIND